MKYFFVVHSNITWLIIKNLIAQEKLPSADCLILIDRNLNIQVDNIQSKNISNFHLYDIKSAKIHHTFSNYQRNKKILAEIDKIINTFCLKNETFHFYLPHQKKYVYFAFFTHAQCERFFYVEEGNLSYASNQFDPKRSKFKYLILSILYSIFLANLVPPFPRSFDFSHPKYGGVYCVNELAFPRFPNKKLLPLPFTNQPTLANIRRVWVFGPYVEFGEMPQEVRIELMRKFLNYLIQNNIKQIHYKFHPSQLLHPDLLAKTKSVLQEYKEKIELVELEQTVSLGDLAYTSKADFYLNTSSAAIYALACGSKVYSYAQEAVKLHPPFQKTVDAIPENIHQKMEFIEIGVAKNHQHV